MTSNVTEAKEQASATAAAPLDEAWFAAAERPSNPPPASTRSQRISSLPPPEPIGDRLADDWFR